MPIRMVMLLFCWMISFLPVLAEELPVNLEASFPYSLNGSESRPASPGSRQLLFISLDHFNRPAEPVSITVTLPEGLKASAGKDWTVDEAGQIHMDWTLPADFGNVFEVIPVTLSSSLSEGTGTVSVSVTGPDYELSRNLDFTVKETAPEEKEKENREESWYIQGVVLPVNESGETDDRLSPNTMVLPDVQLENMKHRLTGTPLDRSALTAKPDTFLLLDMRNPRRDVGQIHFKAELVDRGSGEVKEGLLSASGEEGTVPDHSFATETDFSLNGGKMQTAVIPLYANPFTLSEGDYNLRITLSDGESQKITEIPLTVVKSRSMGMISTTLSCLSLLLVLLSFGKIKKTMISIGARGDIAAALFAALAFGGVVVPVTLAGDFLHVILGPFSGLVTGLLSGVVQYMLLMSLLVLFRRPGVTALFFLIRWLLSAVLFGRVTPVGILLAAFSIVVIEGALYITGFYRKKTLTLPYGLFISLVLGLCDAGITFVNMQQLMLFYRLYYADWFIGLYMVINGLLYSSLGSFLGWKTGSRLRQVMGS
ncbi:hypothetical protein [Dialister succinatiphilus]|uniref:hypothetical protein n=1 Tax=Dialister succinatiphilus TaxID=487173 RepID=UPI0040252401